MEGIHSVDNTQSTDHSLPNYFIMNAVRIPDLNFFPRT